MMIVWVVFLIIICILLYLLQKLTFAGSVTAFIIGGATVVGVGPAGLLLFAVFFGSSILLGKVKGAAVDEEVVEKHGKRDAFQVFANGGYAGLCSVLLVFFPSLATILVAGFVGSLAAAIADTWASEIGKLSQDKPIDVLTRKKVEKGVSGGVTGLGMAAAFAGSFVLAGVAILIWWNETSVSYLWLFFFIFVGFVANLLDSILGSTVQGLYQCPNCGIHTEKLHHCVKTVKIRGFSFVTNDVVNLCCTGAGALMGMIGAVIFF
ncbi:DUF92 domain-containing protein [Shouchella sp. 1P09AA]|uniref:DUF92 domain-containing protein n=1 Tax=unclassified Shouchella TaxID=2893065 RepID=UPI0039A099A9